MPRPFVDQPGVRPDPDPPPIPAPLDPHPTRGGWINRGRAFYDDAFGPDAYAQSCPNDVARPMPGDTPAARRHLWRRTRGAQFLFGFKALATGRRATHMRGVGARGTVTVVAKPTFPEHDFFAAGRVFPCRVRHANASFYDDAASQVRACSVKFADADGDSPLDLVMNTGVIQAFWSFDTFMQFADARVKTSEHSWDSQKEYMRLLPGGMIGAIESVRVAPSSYAAMLYHGAIVYPFRGRDGVQRYARYRCVPEELGRESGFLDDARQREPWVQSRTPGDDRPRAYLGDEFRARLGRGPVTYRLQLQVRTFDPEHDTHEFFNGARVWDPTLFPWHDLAELRLTEPLPDDVTERTQMWLGRTPPTLGLTDAFADVDYRSLAWVRYHVYPVSQACRKLLRRFGMQRKMGNDF